MRQWRTSGHRLATHLLLWLALLGAACPGIPGRSTLLAAGETSRERPNFVVILADDLGYSDIGCYGGEIRTPSLDRLATEGLRFTQFYNCSKCSQTRSSLLSGLYHQRTNENLGTPNHVTLAEVLGAAGYTTLMSGKWHLRRTPLERGFRRYFGFLGGAVNYFTGLDFGKGTNLMRLDEKVFEPSSKGFYTTDAFTDHAIRFLDEAEHEKKPFFLYLAYNAPHFPLQAHPADIARYRGKYLGGWDRLRRARHERMKAIGVVTPKSKLSPRDPIVAAWDSLSDEEKAKEDLLMAVYAAMVECMDRNIGRLVRHLDRLGLASNTVVIFLSDNGGCPYRWNRTPDLPPGPANSARSYDSEWANASNTPFRLYKRFIHEGGIATPMIVRWPAVITKGGSITREMGHVIDLMPTLIELAGTRYPTSFGGHAVLPIDGVSLVPVLHGGSVTPERTVFWERDGNRGVRTGKWKLVAEHARTWELYDLQSDCTELEDLGTLHPERTRKMAAQYDAWARDVGAPTDEVARKLARRTQPR